MKLTRLLPSISIWAGGISLILAGCSPSESRNTEVPVLEVAESSTPDVVIHSMPSALHHADYLMIGEAPFDSKLIVPSALSQSYSTDFERALLLGMYQADLGYAIAHQRESETMALFESVKLLGDELGIFHQMEDDLIIEAEKNIKDSKKLHDLIILAMEEAEYYLHEKEGKFKADVMAAGIWIENSWLATQVIQQEHDQSLMDRIGEDKMILPRIIEDLELHAKDESVAKLVQRLKKAEKVYSKIEIVHEDGEIAHDSASGVTEIHSSHTVSYSMDRLAVITKIMAAIRNGYLQPKES